MFESATHREIWFILLGAQISDLDFRAHLQEKSQQRQRLTTIPLPELPQVTRRRSII